MSNEQTATKAPAKTSPWYWFHVAVGLLFMIGFPQLGPFEPITETGMWIAGIFIGMVYLWSTLDSIWPSLLGLLLVALYSGYLGTEVTGYAAVKAVFLNAIGSDTVITVLLGMILFGGIEYVGCTKYLARFFLTRKIFTGRPYVFLFVVFFCAYFISGFTLAISTPLGQRLEHVSQPAHNQIARVCSASSTSPSCTRRITCLGMMSMCSATGQPPLHLPH